MVAESLLLFKLMGMGLAFMLPLANPLTSMIMFLSLGEGFSQQERQRQLQKATAYVVAMLLVTYYAGVWLISVLGISIMGMHIAGGVIVAYVGFRMLFPIPAAVVADDVAKNSNSAGNIAFVPLCMPGTVGPGSMALIISASVKMEGMHAQYPEWVLLTTPPLLALVLGLLFYLCLRFSARIVKWIGHDGVDVIARIMGFLLVCIGVQLMMDGIHQYMISLSAQPILSSS